MSDKTVNTTEVVSPSQTVASQEAKGMAMQGRLNQIGRGGIASTVTITQGISGVAARAVGVLSVVGPVARAVEVGNLEHQYGGNANAAGLYYAGGLISRDQLIEVIKSNSSL
jgi:hypothetical protein